MAMVGATKENDFSNNRIWSWNVVVGVVSDGSRFISQKHSLAGAYLVRRIRVGI
jgi:hypothetical protein